MTKYTAQIQYDEETVRLLDRMITRTCHPFRQAVWILLAVALIVYGVILGISTLPGIIMTVIGCVLLPATGDIPSRLGNQLLRVMKGKQLRLSYEFYPTYFAAVTGSGRSNNQYETITRLVRAPGYYYLFQGTDKACMIDRKTLVPGDAGSFERFIERASNLSWEEPTGSLQKTLVSTARKGIAEIRRSFLWKICK